VIDKNTEGAFMTYLERLEQKTEQQGVQQGRLKKPKKQQSIY